MNLLRKITLAMVASVLLFATSCVKNEVSDEVKELRKEQLALAKALTAFQNAAATEKEFLAKKQEYEASIKQLEVAKTEAENAQAIAEAAQAKKIAEDALEEQALKHQKEMANLEKQVKLAKIQEDGAVASEISKLMRSYNTAVSNLNTEKKNLLTYQFNLAKAKANLELAKNGSISKETAAQAAVDAQQTLVNQAQDKVTKDSTTLAYYKNSQEFKDIATYKTELEAEWKVKKAEYTKLQAATTKAQNDRDLQKTEKDNLEKIVEIWDNDDTPKGLIQQEKDKTSDIEKKEKEITNMKADITKYEALLKTYTTEFTGATGVEAKYLAKQKALEAEQAKEKNLKNILDAAKKVAGVDGDYNGSHGSYIGDDVDDYIVEHNSGTGNLYNDRGAKGYWYVEVAPTAHDLTTDPNNLYVSGAVAAKVKANKKFIDLVAAEKNYQVHSVKQRNLTTELNILKVRYNFLAKNVNLENADGDAYDADEDHVASWLKNAKEKSLPGLEKEKTDLEAELKVITDKKAAFEPQYTAANSQLEAVTKKYNELQIAYKAAELESDKAYNVYVAIGGTDGTGGVIGSLSGADVSTTIASLTNILKGDRVNLANAQSTLYDKRKALLDNDYSTAIESLENSVTQANMTVQNSEAKIVQLEAEVTRTKNALENALKEASAS